MFVTRFGLGGLLLMCSAVATAQACMYPDRKSGGTLEMHSDCGSSGTDGQFRLRPNHFKRLAFDKNGLACVLEADRAYYFRRDGRSRQTVYFDNGCDDFVAGLARGFDGGELVYVNKALEVVLRPGFELLSPFSYGYAVVCHGPIEVLRIDEEHRGWQSEHCGLIDHQGRLVLAATHRLDDSKVFSDYVNRHNACPPPPVDSAASAVCHARRHLLEEIYPKQAAQKVRQVRQTGDRWWVTFAWCSRFNCDPVVELDAQSADFHSIVPGRKR